MSILFKVVYRFSAVLVKKPVEFFISIKIIKLISNSYGNVRNSKQQKIILRTKLEDSCLDFKTHYKVTITNNQSCTAAIDININQWTRIESPEIKPYITVN
jgi:hypothetical protein